jgi:flagellar motility protein MotE (MotC chaperone)
MRRGEEPGGTGTDYDVRLLIESARDLIEVIRTMGQGLDQRLRQSADVDLVIEVLSKKKEKVETLREVSRQIRLRLRVGDDGRVGVAVSEATRREFAELMADLALLVEEEQELEDLVCGRGFSISRGGRR